jgi:hypothetical protein
MKALNFSKILGQSKAARSVRLVLAAPALVMTIGLAQAGTSASTTETPAEPAAASNWIGFTVGGAFVSGNDAGMQRRTQTNGDFYGGIDTFQFSQALSKSTTLTIDGHALPGLEDYEGNINVTKTDLGYIKAGYKQFRTWYDGSGGYLTGQQYSLPVGGDEMSVDRGEFSFEAGLRMENVPEVTFSYKHAFRNGNKDSLTWGEGIPSNIANVYKTAPASWGLDEKTDTFELDVEHTLGNTDLGLGLVYEHGSYTDTRVNTRGYVTTTPPAKSSNAFRTVSQTDDYTTDLFAGNVHSVTRFCDNLWLSVGLAYNSMDTDTEGGSRSFAYYPGGPLANSRGGDMFYTNMQGGGQVDQFIGNLNLMWVPVPDLTITPSLRYEHEDQSATNSVATYKILVKPIVYSVPSYSADTDMNDTVGALDIRYKGVPDWVFYAKGQWGREDEDVKWLNTSYADPVNRDSLYNDVQIDEQEYTVGANWYPCSGLNFSLQGLYAERNQSFAPTAYDNPAGTVGLQGLVPLMAEHDTQIDDVNLRVTWRPLSNLSFVTRYDYSQTNYSNQGLNWSGSAGTGVDSLNASNRGYFTFPQIDSGITTSNILSESVTWSPLARLYMQGTASWVSAETNSTFTGVTGSDNDYVTGCLTAGYAIDDKTDITGSLTYYGARNYSAYAAPVPAAGAYMGYGLNTQEYGVSLTLTRMLTPNMVWNLRYAFMTSQTDGTLQDQSGGKNDFSAQMVSTGLQVRF